MDDRYNPPVIDTILVPQGAEYRAVCRGLARMGAKKPKILAIPIGSQGLVAYLERWQQSKAFLSQPPRGIVLMGLAGSLSNQCDIGQIVVYQECQSVGREISLLCDSDLTGLIYKNLQEAAKVRGITSTHLIWNAQEKFTLGQQYGVEVVDMEGLTVLEKLQKSGVPISIVRVISDSVQQTLPDLTPAIGLDGSLKPLPLASIMLRQPLASMQLIQGALKGLKILQKTSYQLISTLNP